MELRLSHSPPARPGQRLRRHISPRTPRQCRRQTPWLRFRFHHVRIASIRSTHLRFFTLQDLRSPRSLIAIRRQLPLALACLDSPACIRSRAISYAVCEIKIGIAYEAFSEAVHLSAGHWLCAAPCGDDCAGVGCGTNGIVRSGTKKMEVEKNRAGCRERIEWRTCTGERFFGTAAFWRDQFSGARARRRCRQLARRR